ncbi:urea carboxylase-associated family protein [Brevibacterium sp. 'Marine']|uniref:urea carboxylase-associated family protein n=1 Tax=Brevibacterium sp. 'Marine' TaxID=2725563 RepID=UPI00145E0092|nr:urea carboxylase-associated family protein [Brevibacterium sp. 'Marine']
MAQSRLQEAAYQGPALEVDRDFYSQIGEDTQSREIIDEFTIPIRSGQAWDVPAGHVCRISTVDGPQVGDLNLWNRHDPRERFWAARTRQLQAAHVSTFDRLWSTLPFLRPMATIVGDTLSDYGTDPEGGRVHDTLGTRCDPYVSQMLSGVDFDYHCHSNLVRAILPYGLTEFDVHDVLNVFQCTGLNSNDEYFMKTCPARPGDHFEFFAEQDLLAALSTCPGGDLSAPMFGDGSSDPVENCHPLQVTVYRLPADLLGEWEEPSSPNYRGAHGLRPQPWA